MANKQDIITAIKNLDLFLKVPELQGAKVRFNKNGNPFAYVGGFNMVFQLEKDNEKWAFRVWHIPMGDTKERYQSISKYLEEKSLPYFAEFIFDEKGILVNGELLDTIRMKWLDGMLFKEYVEKHLSNPQILKKLAEDFAFMCKDLRDNKISHGDLQEGNILITDNGEIKLVDYDSICIPSIDGEKELVTGLKGYQHPSRFSGSKASIKADYFSELVIYLSIKSIAEDSTLWDKYQVKDTQYLLFTENDFTDFENSNIYADLKKLSPKINVLLSVLSEYLKINNYTDLKPFQSYLLPPKIKIFKADKEVLIQGSEITLEWEVENAIDIEINNSIGKVKAKDKLTLIPNDNIQYIIKAIGFNDIIEEPLDIKVFPTPIIKSLQVSSPSIEKITNIAINLPQFPNINLGINNIKNDINIELKPTVNQPKFNNQSPMFNKLDDDFNFLNKNTGYLSSLLRKIKYKNNKILSKIFNS